MATLPLGAPALASLLGDQSRVRLRNDTAPDDLAVIVAVVLARHDGQGNVASEVEFGLDLAAGEHAFFEPRPASTTPPALVELLLRVRIEADSAAASEGQGALLDVYLQATPAPDPAPARGFDCGLRRHEGEIEADEQLLPGFVDLAAFARPVR